MIRLEDVYLSAGTKELLREASFHLTPNMRAGLVGRNGTGKTSLLRALVGQLDADSGKITLRSGKRLGYLPQQAVSGSTATVWDEARSQMSHIDKLRTALEDAQRALEAGTLRAAERHAAAEDAFRIAGGYAIDEAIGTVLHGLGFAPSDWQRTCDTFSGGWQMRIALARLLLSEPDVLLLDEPTNHLDLHARSWLAGFLSTYPHAMMVVSHDRHLLDRVATHTVEIRGKRLHTFKGNLSAWLRERQARLEQTQSAFSAQQDEIARLERFVTRFKAKATKAAAARSRQKVLDKMERIEAPERDKRPRFRLPEAPGCSTETIVLTDAVVAWPDGPPILDGVDFTLVRGQRIAVLGPNGCGKSTLLHALSGRLAPTSGRRRLGKDVRIGLFNQDLAQELPAEATALEVVLESAPAALPQQARSALGALGLPGDMCLRAVGGLSGGEKARVALARFAVRPYNVLLLDEPTNHLDAVTVDVLVEALRDFEGAVLFVTHDRWMVEQLATHVAHVSDGAVTLREGVVAEDFEPVAARRTDAETSSDAKVDYAERKKAQRELERARKRIGAIGPKIEKLEAKVQQLEDALFTHAADRDKSAEILAEQSALEAKVAALYEEWEQLDEMITD